MSQGIIFATFGAAPYFAQACLAAASIRRFDTKTPIAIYTDAPQNPLIKSGLFNEIIDSGPLAFDDYPFPYVAPLLARGQALLESPFDRTLAIDVDLRLRAPKLDSMFGMLDHVEIAMGTCEVDSSLDRQLYGDAMFNNGVILYRKTAKTEDVFRRMLTNYRENLQLAEDDNALQEKFLHITDVKQKKRLLMSDQTALAPIFSPGNNICDLSYAILGDHWNWRGGAKGRQPAEPLIIDHHPSLRDDSWGQLALLAADILLSGNGKLASILYHECMSVCEASLIKMKNKALVASLNKEPSLKKMIDDYSAAHNGTQEKDNILKIASLHFGTFNDVATAKRILSVALKTDI